MPVFTDAMLKMILVKATLIWHLTLNVCEIFVVSILSLSSTNDEVNLYLFFWIIVAPVVKQKPKIVKQQKKIIIEIRIASGAPPKIQWMRETTIIKEDIRHHVVINQVMKGEYAVILEIDKPEKLDEGSYKCVAKNEKGECISPAILVGVEGLFLTFWLWKQL